MIFSADESGLPGGLTTFAYFAAMVFFFAHLATRSRQVALIGNILAYGGFVLNAIALGLRWYESYQLLGEHGRAPLTNLYESVVFFAWTILIIYILIDLKYRQPAVGPMCHSANREQRFGFGE